MLLRLKVGIDLKSMFRGTDYLARDYATPRRK
jgi:hypothetical protein